MSPVRTPVKSLVAAFSLSLPLPFALSQAPPAPPTDQQLYSRLDSDRGNVVLLYDALKGTPIVDLSAPDARQQFSLQDAAKIIARGFGNAPNAMPLGKVTDGLTVPGRSGNQIPIRLYTPVGTGPFPVIV